MHSDTPIRVLDEIIRRYGVTCLKLVPFDGGGYAVEIGSHVQPVNVGAGGLGEAIGKAFLELMRLQGRPSFEELLEMSSLGTPRAKRLRAQADPKAVEKILERVQSPAVHWQHGERSACGLVHVGRANHARFARLLEEVTCGRCRHSSWYRSEVVAKRARRS